MITSLALTQFRNHTHFRAKDIGRFVALVGANGSGKTNILEAISFLSPGRGIRRAKLSEVGKHGCDGSWSIFAQIHGEQSDHKIGTGLTPERLFSDVNSREIRIDGQKNSSQNALLDICRMLWLTPQMDGLFMGGASDRRRFIDRWVTTFDPSHAHNLTQYEKAMRQRNRALVDPHFRSGYIDSLEDIMAQHGVAAALARHQHVERLRLSTQKFETQSAFPWSKIALEGDIEVMIGNGAGLTELEDRFKDMLKSRRPVDLEAGRTTKGPHKTDFIVWHGPKDIEARLSSTGEQKALLIGLLLAQLDLLSNIDGDISRILLLDEIAAHLDIKRRQALFEHLKSSQLQIWMTGTDEEVFYPLLPDLELISIKEDLV